MKWKETVVPSVIAALVTAALLAIAGKIVQLDIKGWLGIPRIQSGVVAITDSRDVRVQFDAPFSTPPVVAFGPVYSEHSKGEAFAAMTDDPSKDGFAVRLVRVGAGGSTPGEFGRGKVNWIAVGQ